METGYHNQNWDVIQFGAFPSVNPSVYKKTESSLKIKYDESPLGNACSLGKLEIVKRLVDEGSDVNQKDFLNMTPIVRAASNGHRNVVEFLVKRGARISYALLTTVKTRIDEVFGKLIGICKKNKTAIRIGSNHGSLSGRLVNRYGDTAEGMAQSVLEFLRIAQKNDFHELVISLKASNTRVMVYAYRTLMNKMLNEGMNYPLHLGVTEAGDGEDGRIKSAIGIGTLLSDGIGDTVRVSLTEDPEKEIPVARKIVDYCTSRQNDVPVYGTPELLKNPFEYSRRKTFNFTSRVLNR